MQNEARWVFPVAFQNLACCTLIIVHRRRRRHCDAGRRELALRLLCSKPQGIVPSADRLRRHVSSRLRNRPSCTCHEITQSKGLKATHLYSNILWATLEQYGPILWIWSGYQLENVCYSPSSLLNVKSITSADGSECSVGCTKDVPDV